MASVSMILILITILSFIAWFIKFHLQRRGLYKMAEEFSGPPCLPILGNSLKFLIPLTELTERILYACSLYKSPARMWFGPHLTVYIWDPENAKIVLNSPHALEKQPHLYKLVEPIAGRGLITSPVNEWKHQRKLLACLFNQKNLENFFDVFNEHVKVLLEDVDAERDAGNFNVHDYLAKYSLNSLLDALLDYNEYKKDVNSLDVYKWISTMFVSSMTKLTTIWYSLDFVFNRTKVGMELESARSEYHTFLDSMIDKWKQVSIEKLEKDNAPLDLTDAAKPRKLIEYLLSSSDQNSRLTLLELREHIMTFIVAGLETTSAAIGFIYIMLGMHPEVQDKVYQEVTDVLSNNAQLCYENLKDLTYLETVIKETLRLFPPSVGVGRYSTQDIPLKNHTIPAGTSILIGLISLHRNPDVWPNPNKFDPDRFLPDEEAKRHPYSWIPFLAGPRNCLGIRYALISLKTAVAYFVTKYKISTDYKSVEDIRLLTRVMYEPADGYKISITSRHR